MSGIRWEPGVPRILVDCRYTRIGRHDGISRFTAGIVTELGRLHPIVMLISDERQLTMLPELPWVLGPSPTSALEPLISLRTLNALEPDIVFSPMQTIGGIGRRFTLVTTVHDLIYYSHPKPPSDLPGFVRLAWRLYHTTYAFQRWLLRGSDAHATVSETTARLMAEHRMAARPVQVVLNGVAHPETPPRRTPPHTRDILYAGSYMPYKNVEALATALHHLPGWRLRLLSAASAETMRSLSALAPAGALDFMGGASDAEYAAALEQARVFATASREEGFGLPVAEALAAGTPVAISDIPIFHEVAGEHAEYFDPEDPADIARAIERLEDDELWLERSVAGERWSRRYDWASSAAVLLDFLLGVASSGTGSPR